ncbi:MAG: ROK family protein [Clostridia bacterium]
MKFKGIEFETKNIPVLDKTFVPMHLFNKAFLKDAKKPISIAVERNAGLTAVYDTFIHGTSEYLEADKFYIERMVKLLLWAKGGYKVTICGDETIADYIKETYSATGKRNFDFDFMSKVYEMPFEVFSCDYDKRPKEFEKAKPLGRHLDGCRIGFDAGGSDRKVSAVIDGEPVFSEEVEWFPKITADPTYHFNGIVDAMKTAASHMPRVDAIGVSSAGIYIDNRAMVASLFLKVPEDQFNEKVKDIYLNAAREIGENIPIEVANDGDVTALAGAMSLNDNNILGIAMGTSEAVGYVDCDGNVTGWLNELAFAPVDGQDDATEDEWSHDIGCGVKYFSQDGVIKLAPRAGIELDEKLSPADKLKVVQKCMESNDNRATDIYSSIGVYLGHTAAYYTTIYDIKHILLLGRVTSGEGGNIIIDTAKRVLNEDYPEVASKINLQLPDEKSRRVGQSVAAASLPEIL